jgi:DNA-binding transcriptional regulator LsrR (DeoR family)
VPILWALRLLQKAKDEGKVNIYVNFVYILDTVRILTDM